MVVQLDQGTALEELCSLGPRKRRSTLVGGLGEPGCRHVQGLSVCPRNGGEPRGGPDAWREWSPEVVSWMFPEVDLGRGGPLHRPWAGVGLPLSKAPKLNDSQTLKCNGLCPAGFGNCVGPVTPVFLPPYGNVYMHPTNVPPLSVGSKELVRSYQRSRANGENLALGETMPDGIVDPMVPGQDSSLGVITHVARETFTPGCHVQRNGRAMISLAELGLEQLRPHPNNNRGPPEVTRRHAYR
ncbi:uncharacterized protein LOC143676764 [Tamandua tetradactyla]|uniref:uncharacterized protein LOC143676764 n=1 Tax=Tamandua tetradactyla TaxID=48850 RepID=UPI0040548586